MQRGKFIVIEGGEGSGKDTHFGRMQETFDAAKFLFTREPGGTPIGEKIRALLLDAGSQAVDERAELMMFLAARAELVGKVIEPALSAGMHVVSNRFSLSTLAYQVVARQHPEYLPLIAQFDTLVLKGEKPDLCVLLDVPPEVGLERVHLRPETLTRFDLEALAFHERVRQGYLEHASNSAKQVVIIDATQSKDDVWADVKKAVESAV